MKNLGTHVALVLALCVLLVWWIYPPKERLRLGKDLRGGVSLTYSVKLPEGGNREAALAQVIDVLKQRVNPTGVLDISFAPQGTDRIEVVMPLPNPEVRQLQVEFREAVAAAVRASRVDRTELEQAIAAGTAVDRFGGGDDTRVAVLTDLQATAKAAAEARATLEKAAAAGDEKAERAAQAQVAAAEVKLESAIATMASAGLSEARLLRSLAMSAEKQVMRDNTTGEPLKDDKGQIIRGPSERETELAAIRSEFPAVASRMDAVETAWRNYESQRTGLDDPEDLKRLFRGAGVLEFFIAVDPSNPEGVNPADLRKQLAERGPANTDSPVARWFKVQDLKQWANTPQQLAAVRADPGTFFAGRRMVGASYQGEVYVLLYVTDAKSLTHGPGREWAMVSAAKTVDELGLPAVSFNLDRNGGFEMSRLTGPNVGRLMAIVLDGQVYSAPNLQSRIDQSGRITGKFSEEEIRYLIRVLAAGSLSGQLSPEPISMNVLGPAMGADNLQRGMRAVGYSVVAVGVLMLVWYLVAGVMANIALAVAVLIIFGTMAFIDSTFTMPGLAGIALAIGIAVDANVLVYERIREEIVQNGESLRNAVRLGFSRAATAIVDGNLSNLIICIVLVMFAGTEVKGFGVTMMIGVFATLIAGLWVSRVLMNVYIEWMGARSLPMMGTVSPGLMRALTPRVDWVKARPVLLTVAAVASATGLALAFSRGSDLLDTEFRGGVAMTMSTRRVDTTPYTVKEGDTVASLAASVPGGGVPPRALSALNPRVDLSSLRPGQVIRMPTGVCSVDGRVLMSREDVEQRVRQIADGKPDSPMAQQFRGATVLTVGEQTPDFRSSSFQVKVGNPTGPMDESAITGAAVSALSEAFVGVIDAQLPRRFQGRDSADHAPHTRPLDKDTIGAALGRPGMGEAIGTFRGGVGVVLEGIDPPITLDDAQLRIERLRNQPDFSDISGRPTRVVGLDLANPADPSQGYRSVALLVTDPQAALPAVSVETWDSRLAKREWQLASQALAQGTSLDQVSSFSPSVARMLLANAVVAVIISLLLMLVYIWLRFGSFRYSVGTVLALGFNLCVSLGFLSLSKWLAPSWLGQWAGIQEYRIDLNVVAGLLVIVGYDINDSIVILDRVRERKGKLHYATRRILNDAVNQTFTRTMLTASTTILSAIILVAYGGESIRAFTVTILVGLLAGTFSSVGVAAPLAYSSRHSGDDPEPATAGRTDAALPSHA